MHSKNKAKKPVMAQVSIGPRLTILSGETSLGQVFALIAGAMAFLVFFPLKASDTDVSGVAKNGR